MLVPKISSYIKPDQMPFNFPNKIRVVTTIKTRHEIKPSFKLMIKLQFRRQSYVVRNINITINKSRISNFSCSIKITVLVVMRENMMT